MSFVTVTLDLPDWLFERLGSPDYATLERLAVEALTADLLRTGRAEVDEARRWLGLDNAPDAMDAFLQAHGLANGLPEAGLAAEFRALRRGQTLSGLKPKDLITEGRDLEPTDGA